MRSEDYTCNDSSMSNNSNSNSRNILDTMISKIQSISSAMDPPPLLFLMAVLSATTVLGFGISVYMQYAYNILGALGTTVAVVTIIATAPFVAFLYITIEKQDVPQEDEESIDDTETVIKQRVLSFLEQIQRQQPSLPWFLVLPSIAALGSLILAVMHAAAMYHLRHDWCNQLQGVYYDNTHTSSFGTKYSHLCMENTTTGFYVENSVAVFLWLLTGSSLLVSAYVFRSTFIAKECFVDKDVLDSGEADVAGKTEPSVTAYRNCDNNDNETSNNAAGHSAANIGEVI